MKITFQFVYDTETRRYSPVDLKSNEDDIEVVHSGSSYLRIKLKGSQIGTIGVHCPGTEELTERMLFAQCHEGSLPKYNHLNFSMLDQIK